MIDATEKYGRIFVSMPFALKNDFRANFPAATFHGDTKQWSVADEYKHKIRQWIDAAESGDIYDEEARAHALTMNHRDIERTRKAVEQAQAKLSAQLEALQVDEQESEKLAAAHEKSIALIRSLRDEIEAEINSKSHSDRERLERENEIETELSPLIDRLEVAQAAATMARYEDAKVSLNEKQAWQQAQDKIIEARNNLRNACLSLEALDYLAELRHGRDTVRNMPPAAWHTLSRFKN